MTREQHEDWFKGQRVQITWLSINTVNSFFWPSKRSSKEFGIKSLIDSSLIVLLHVFKQDRSPKKKTLFLALLLCLLSFILFSFLSSSPKQLVNFKPYFAQNILLKGKNKYEWINIVWIQNDLLKWTLMYL